MRKTLHCKHRAHVCCVVDSVVNRIHISIHTYDQSSIHNSIVYINHTIDQYVCVCLCKHGRVYILRESQRGKVEQMSEWTNRASHVMWESMSMKIQSALDRVGSHTNNFEILVRGVTSLSFPSRLIIIIILVSSFHCCGALRCSLLRFSILFFLLHFNIWILHCLSFALLGIIDVYFSSNQIFIMLEFREKFENIGQWSINCELASFAIKSVQILFTSA